MIKKYLDVGKIVGTHGIKGSLRVQPWCDSPEFLCKFKTLYFNNGEESLTVLSSKVNKNIVILTIDGIDTIEKADLLKNKLLYINRDDADLEEGTYFIQDIIDMQVIDIDTLNIYGTVSDVIKTGANDVYQVTTDKNKDYLIPVIDDVVIKIDMDSSKIFIRPIKGIFDDED